MSKKPVTVRVSPRYPETIINVLGNRDPRGYDNQISVFLDSEDKLHIRVWKADRCYSFSHVEETKGYIETIQV